MSDDSTALLKLNQRLLDAIAAADWKTYAELCDPTLSAFEPESRGHLIEGMPFHQTYFDRGAPEYTRVTTIASPHVRMMGDAAVVSYVRLTQVVGKDGQVEVTATQETRVWQRQQAGWRHVHFHRSPL
jgi:calcium/calmodulin-dependent protein kinase (CaM kinase) II